VGATFRTGAVSTGFENCGAALVMAAGTAATVVLQYTRRRTTLARGIVAGTLVLAAATAYAPVWGGAFAIEKVFFSGRPGGLPHLSFDTSRAGAHPMRWSRSSNDPDGVRLEIPLRVDNVPPGERLGAEWTSVVIDGPTGEWRSGWLRFLAFHGLSHGEAWLTVYVDPEFYRRNQDIPVRLYGKVDFMLYRRAGGMMAPRVGEAVAPGVGLCTFTPEYGTLTAEEPPERVGSHPYQHPGHVLFAIPRGGDSRAGGG